MNDIERRILHSYKTKIQSGVDPICVVDELYKHNLVSQAQKLHLFRKCIAHLGRQSGWEDLFNLIPNVCELQQLLRIFLKCGYTDLALEIRGRCRSGSEERSAVCRIYRSGCRQSSQRFAQRLFMNMKINTHNNNFVNPRKFCHDESQKYKVLFQQSFTKSDAERSELADKYAACLLAEIDSHIMLYAKNETILALTKELKRLIPESSNSLVTQMSYESRVAMAYALEGNDSEEEKHMQLAMGACVLVNSCVEISNLLYIYVFNLLCRFEKYPSSLLRDKIIHIAELGLSSVEDEDENIREFWVRIFILRIVYCLIGLSFRGDPIYGIKIEENSIQRAKRLLSEIDRLWGRIEARRKIMYYVAKARVAELEQQEGYQSLVNLYLGLAIEIGSEGDYGETKFVKLYASYFQNQGNDNGSESGKATNFPSHYVLNFGSSYTRCYGTVNKSEHFSVDKYTPLSFGKSLEPESTKPKECDETELKVVNSMKPKNTHCKLNDMNCKYSNEGTNLKQHNGSEATDPKFILHDKYEDETIEQNNTELKEMVTKKDEETIVKLLDEVVPKKIDDSSSDELKSDISFKSDETCVKILDEDETKVFKSHSDEKQLIISSREEKSFIDIQLAVKFPKNLIQKC